MPKADARPSTGLTGTLAEESTGLANAVRDFPHTRRSLLAGAATGLAAATVAALPAVAASAVQPDPHPAWWAEHQRLVEFIDAPGRDQAAVDAAFDRESELEEWIARTPAATIAGVRAQVAFAHRSLDVVSSFNELDVEALESALEALERMGGEAAHV